MTPFAFYNNSKKLKKAMKSSKIFIWQQLLCLALTTHMCNAWHFNTSFYILWCSDTHFNQQSSYQTNLKSVFSSLLSNSAKTSDNGYYATNTTAINGPASQSETIYGLYDCRGDNTPEECRQCVKDALSYLPPKECPNDKGVIIWYRSCKVRYSNRYFLGVVEEYTNYGWSNNENVSTISYMVDIFMSNVTDSLHDLGTQLGSSRSQKEDVRRFFGTKSVTVNRVKLYTMAACMANLSPTNCEMCIGFVTNELSKCCYGSRGGTALNPSCYARYEIYPFYKSVASPSTPPPSLTLPDLSKGHSNRNPKMSRKHRRWKKVLFIFLVGAVIVIIALLLLLFFCIWVRKGKTTNETAHVEIEDDLNRIVDSLQFDFNTIKTATSHFSANHKVGEGGFGEVYKGKLKNGQEVAVKRLSKNTGHGIEQFRTEVDVVAKLQHKNLVKLLGFCASSNEKMLVYEYLSNSSLDRFIFGNETNLDWETRFKIIIGIARGLMYLHEDSRLKIVHRDLKSSNILLDEDMNPKISDFGLAKLFEADQTRGDTQKIVGTYGYIAPEYAINGSYSVKSDVYSFGVIILEMLSGRKNSHLCEKQQEETLLSTAWRLWTEEKALDLVDPTLNNIFSKDEVLKCIHIGLLCIQEHANDRPRMNSIVAALNGHTIDFPMPNPPLFVGRVTNAIEEAKTLEQSESFSSYTGFDTITVLLPRE